MQTLPSAREPDDDPKDGSPVGAADIGRVAGPAEGPDAADVEAVGSARLSRWPAAIARLYEGELRARLYREHGFLFLLGLLVCLSTVAVDLLISPGLVQEGIALRIAAVVPLTIAGLFAGLRKQTRLLALCVGAAPIAFIGVIFHLAFHLPPEIGSRYLYATALVAGIGNLTLPYSMRGLLAFDLAAIAVATGVTLSEGWVAFTGTLDILLVFALATGATLAIAARFERLRQENFLLTLRTQIAARDLFEANRALQSLSETDPLTGIANRRCFEREFEAKIRAPGPDGRVGDSIALIMIDLDHFKAFNDTHGHQSGDYCLQRVAAILRDVFEDAGGIVARYGGEEFIAALRKHDAEEIRAIAEDVRTAIGSALVPASGEDGSLVTASIGIGMAPAGAMLPREELVEMADAALYSGKSRGRNRVEFVEADAAYR